MTSLSAPRRLSAQDLEDRTGYDPAFLGVDVPLPCLSSDVPTALLHYLHYSVLHRPDRRFAALTALAMDGARLRTIERDDDWELDPRIAAELQAGPHVYSRNDLDRGHLVMRAASTWGDDDEEARRASIDTFFFPNAAPQASMFNQGRKLWLGLEEYVMDHAGEFDRKLVVLCGPVLDPADPPYRGIQVPLRFWKVVAFVQDGGLAATGYVLDQSPLVDDLTAALADAAAAGEPPPLGAFRMFQVPIADIAMLAGVRLDQLVAVDRLPAPPSPVPPAPGHPGGGWVQLEELEDIRL